MTKIKKLYYMLTAYIPRPLPVTEEQFMFFKSILMEVYGVDERSDTWMCVVGGICSTPAHKMRRGWGHIANHAKRLRVNALAQSYRARIQLDLEKKLEELTAAEAARVEPISEVEVPVAPV